MQNPPLKTRMKRLKCEHSLFLEALYSICSLYYRGVSSINGYHFVETHKTSRVYNNNHEPSSGNISNCIIAGQSFTY